jgi:predicted anti-sigma-YlaC factor YlaD
MNCEQYEEQISLLLDGELDISGESGLFGHLGMCKQCREYLKNIISLRNVLAQAPPMSVPVSLDKRVLSDHSLTKAITPYANFIRHYTNARYSFRAVGLAIIVSALLSMLFSSFWHTSKEPQQTIVCLTPLPEVEVNGYVVVAPTNLKGVEQ